MNCLILLTDVILFTYFYIFWDKEINKTCEICWHTCFPFNITLNLATAFSNGEKNHLTGNKYIFDGNLERKLLCVKNWIRNILLQLIGNWIVLMLFFTTDELWKKCLNIFRWNEIHYFDQFSINVCEAFFIKSVMIENVALSCFVRKNAIFLKTYLQFKNGNWPLML